MERLRIEDFNSRICFTCTRRRNSKCPDDWKDCKLVETIVGESKGECLTKAGEIYNSSNYVWSFVK